MCGLAPLPKSLPETDLLANLEFQNNWNDGQCESRVLVANCSAEIIDSESKQIGPLVDIGAEKISNQLHAVRTNSTRGSGGKK